MDTDNKINQDSIDRKLELDHEINILVSNHLDDFDENGLSVIKYIRKELKRVHKDLRKYSHTGKLS